ncbi:MAG: glycoside hydrolase family 15 protein, partial [Pedobacter sp.]
MTNTSGYLPIEDYGIIGNMKTVALVSLDASIDFMCFPDFDAPTVFARLLDKDNGGSFKIVPQMENCKTKQLYIPGTSVLLTRFFSDEGIAEITDYMPVKGFAENSICAIVRHIKTIRGKVNYKIFCEPRFDYAKADHTTEKKNKQEIFFTAINDGNTMARLLADFPLHVKKDNGYAEVTINQGDSCTIVLESIKQGDTTELRDIGFYSNGTYQETVNFWKSWIGKSTYAGRWTELVHRSVITLKLLTSANHGSMVAAATFGLPESIHGNRNWDYRFNWIRDAAFTMYAFLQLGFTEEATKFLKWIHERSSGDKLHLVYSIAGDEVMKETELKNLEGYAKSQPVRIGNAAGSQLQLDIYGELIDTIYIYNKNHQKINHELWLTIVKHIEHVIKDWKKPDHGIWEFRNGKKHFLHSRLMCWVAIDRAIKIADDRSFPYPAAEWKAERDRIYNDIFDGFWNEKIGAWVQYKGGDT